jgi:hypothetical protein
MPELGPWTPDLPQHGHSGLVTARNTYFLEGGYKPVKAPSAFTAALAAGWKGGGYFRGTGGNNKLLAGTNSGLNEYSGSAWALDFAAARTAPWFFGQFGDLVISVADGAPVKYTLATSTGALLAGSPPTSSMIAIVDPGFVFLAGNSSATNRVYWSGLEAPETWTIGTNQCDVQDIPDGGPITGLAGGEVGLVFQADAIHEFAYVGKPTIFNRRTVSRQIGAICHGGIAQAGAKVFFLDSRGFYMYENGGLAPIGKFKVDRTFLDAYTVSQITANLRAAVDPDRSLVIWSMPDRMWIYNWDQDRWTDIVISGLVGVSTGASSSATLEDIAVTYPSIEDVTPVLDDPFWNGGSPLLLIAKSDNILYSFGGTNLEATFKLPNVEMFPGREAHARNTRLVGDPTSCTVSMEARRRLGDAAVSTTVSTMQSNGDVPIRSSGRYLQGQIVIPAGHMWTYLQGYDVEAAPGGRL